MGETAFVRLMVALLAGVAMAAVALAAYVVAKVVQSDGRVDYCYLTVYAFDDNPIVQRLHGHRNWRADIEVFAVRESPKFSTIDGFNAAIEHAKKIGCPLK